MPERRVQVLLVGASLLCSLAQAAETEGARSDAIEAVRKVCDCVRKHPNGFPYIEQRITTCKTYKNAEGHVKSLDCLNCYALCSDKPAS